MDAFVIDGGAPLAGRIRIRGSKNASLPLMAASLLADEPVVLREVPDLRDIRNMRSLLGELGVESEELADADPEGPGGLRFRVVDPVPSHARYDIVRTMRASICVLGPLLARRGRARVSMPGGCAIGQRPVDLHLRGLEALGASIHLEGGDIVATAERLRGATIFLGGPYGSTVLGTANVMSAAALAEGRTVIEAAACEPEIVDLARLLESMGARVRGAGSPRIVIEGVEQLRGADHRVMPDRIEAGTYLVAAAVARGRITLESCPRDCLLAVLDRLQAMDVRIETPHAVARPANHPAHDEAAAPPAPTAARDPWRETLVVDGRGLTLRPVQVSTQPYPGYPTDLQAQLMALVCLADGNSVITERVFPERFLHVAELSRMGARIYRQGPTAVVSGVRELVGAPVMASDLRASAGLVLAGLAARGRTVVHRVYHLDRGYERMERRLATLGARIERVDADALPQRDRLEITG